jgi:hypothetical protein
LPLEAVAETILAAAPGQILSLGGITAETLRAILHDADPASDGRLTLFVRIAPSGSAEAIVEQVLARLADTARRVWPVWFTDVSFADYGRDALGREAARLAITRLAHAMPTLFRRWAELAVLRASEGRLPRISGTARELELAQLAIAINRAGLTLVADVAEALDEAESLVHALEWIVRRAGIAVVALFPELPVSLPPFDRIAYGARQVTGAATGLMTSAEIEPTCAPAGLPDDAWLDPVLGRPHPLSAIEQRVCEAIGRDAELAPLFGFNQVVETVRGGRPKVDLLWRTGRVVVELDGWEHNTRGLFMRDRHRDYELLLSGYAVLRIANDEVAQDLAKAIEKIRDVVKMRRM